MRIDGRCGSGAEAATELVGTADNSLHLLRYCACMAVAMRERWTDERLDDLKGSVDDGFRRMDERFAEVDRRFSQLDDKVDKRFEQLEEKLDRRFDAIDRRFGLMEQRFDTVMQRFDTVMHSFFYGVIALSSAMVTGFVALAIAAL